MVMESSIDEIKRAFEHTGREPSDVYVKNLMTALDFDNGQSQDTNSIAS